MAQSTPNHTFQSSPIVRLYPFGSLRGIAIWSCSLGFIPNQLVYSTGGEIYLHQVHIEHYNRFQNRIHFLLNNIRSSRRSCITYLVFQSSQNDWYPEKLFLGSFLAFQCNWRLQRCIEQWGGGGHLTFRYIRGRAARKMVKPLCPRVKF